jgi:hypothetical protein
MIVRYFRKEVVLAGFAAEAQAPMMMADQTKLSPTVCTAVLQLGHEVLPSIWNPLARLTRSATVAARASFRHPTATAFSHSAFASNQPPAQPDT